VPDHAEGHGGEPEEESLYDQENWKAGWMPSQFGNAENLVFKTDLHADCRAELDALREKMANYENGITWQTTCLKCAETIDRSATVHLGVLEERDALRAQVEQLNQANVTLSGENTGLAEDNDALQARNDKQTRMIESLRARLKQTEAALNVVVWQSDSYLARARAELMEGVGLWLCETALNHIRDTAINALEAPPVAAGGGE
jgi:chromosome segregation ATPase